MIFFSTCGCRTIDRPASKSDALPLRHRRMDGTGAPNRSFFLTIIDTIDYFSCCSFELEVAYYEHLRFQSHILVQMFHHYLLYARTHLKCCSHFTILCIYITLFNVHFIYLMQNSRSLEGTFDLYFRICLRGPFNGINYLIEINGQCASEIGPYIISRLVRVLHCQL